MNDILASKAREFFPNMPTAPSTPPSASTSATVAALQAPPDAQTLQLPPQVAQYIQEIEERLAKIKSLYGGAPAVNTRASAAQPIQEILDENMYEGVFNGELMVSSDGQTFPVPPNYASKSKLVEGDMLKVTVQPDGTLVFKQIGPIERERKIGELIIKDDSTCCVTSNGYSYCVLRAAVTFHKGKQGDKVVVLVPKDSPSMWAAVEYIITD